MCKDVQIHFKEAWAKNLKSQKLQIFYCKNLRDESYDKDILQKKPCQWHFKYPKMFANYFLKITSY